MPSHSTLLEKNFGIVEQLVGKETTIISKIVFIKGQNPKYKTYQVENFQ